MPTPAGCWSSAAPGSTGGIGVARRGYGKIDPVHATELFIREGLVNDTITWPFDSSPTNRKVRDKVEIVLTRTRSSGYLNLDEATYRFYAARLLPAGAAAPLSPAKRLEDVAPPVSAVASVPDLIDLVRNDG